MKSVSKIALCVAFSTAGLVCAAAEYPAELMGKFAENCADSLKQEKEMGGWYALIINKKDKGNGEFGCIPKKIEGGKGKFNITEKCSYEDESSTKKYAYEIAGNKLTIKVDKETKVYEKCSK